MAALRRPELERRLDRLDPAIRCYLFYGPDDSGSRLLAARVAAAMGADAERVDLSPAQLREDPALLSDEAASSSLFGGARHIRVEGAGEESLAAVDGLMTAAVAGNPAVLIGGALKKDSKLVKRLESDAAALVFQSWPEPANLPRLAVAHGATLGLRIGGDVAQRLADAAGDQAILLREVGKLALYADADPAAPVTLTHDMVDAVGVDSGETDQSRLLDAVFGGDLRALDEELGRIALDTEAIGLIRFALRRLTAAAAGSRGWRPRTAGADPLDRWQPTRVARAIERFAALERTLKTSRGPGSVAAAQFLVGLARSARR